MIGVKINDFELLVKSNISILDACKYSGLHIPRFCYHEILSVSGNCRMCLVEIEGIEKPLASCVAEVDEGMSIWIDTPFVKKARENVVEALLLNHPLDCPICDQAGECDLQDQTKVYGSSYSRFFFEKNGVEDKECSPLIKTIMTRCITCTRCVRYATEVAGIEYFGTLNRGSGTEIGSYVSKVFESEISGNIIDLCPVGALTARPYAFKTRPWELRLLESIDITDSLGSNIYVNSKETEIFRVLPKSNNKLNGSLISDKARFSYDANSLNRIDQKYKLLEEPESFVSLSWDEFFDLTDLIYSSLVKLDFIIDEKCDFETALYLKKVSYRYPNGIKLYLSSKTRVGSNFYVSFKNNNINKTIDNSDFFILLGTNLRLEHSLLNARLRLAYRNKFAEIISLGLVYEENVPTNFVNLNMSKILEVFEGKSLDVSKALIKSKAPCILIGENFTNRIDSLDNFVYKLKKTLPNKNTSIICLKNSSNSEGLALIHIKERSSKIKNSIVAINLDDNVVNRRLYLENPTNLIWFNSHGSYLASKFNQIIPTFTHFEAEQIYINLEGRPQKTQKIASHSTDIRTLKDLIMSTFLIRDVNYFDNTEYSFIKEILDQGKKFDNLKDLDNMINSITENSLRYNSACLLTNYPLKQNSKDFYNSDTFTRNSSIMQECSSTTLKGFTNFYKDEYYSTVISDGDTL